MSHISKNENQEDLEFSVNSMKKQAPAVDAEMKLDEIQNEEKGDSREELHMDGSNEQERPAAIEVA